MPGACRGGSSTARAASRERAPSTISARCASPWQGATTPSSTCSTAAPPSSIACGSRSRSPRSTPKSSTARRRCWGACYARASSVAARLVPDLAAPDEFRAIVNAHYYVAAPAESPLFVGLVGGAAEWVFRKREVLSVTISAADRFIDTPADELAALLWRDVVRAYELRDATLPPWQIVKERRATFAATPAQLRRRPPAATRWANLVLAGDWTATGLPATIEGAIRSGFAAASQLLRA